MTAARSKDRGREGFLPNKTKII